jgi:hypothetical protein
LERAPIKQLIEWLFWIRLYGKAVITPRVRRLGAPLLSYTVIL